MDYPFCEHPQPHKHGRTSKGSQHFKCANCNQTFTEEPIDTLYYGRRVPPEQIETILQAHAEGSSLRGISRIRKRAYGTVVSLVRAASQKAQLVHNEEVQAVECEAIVSDEMWSLTSGKTGRHWKTPLVSRREVFRRDSHTCQYCGSTKKLTLDHVLPRSKGGTHTWDNVVTACERCNASKGDSPLERLRQRLLHETSMQPITKPKAPLHPAIAFAEQFWQEQADPLML